LDVENEIYSIASKSPSEDARYSQTTKTVIIKEEKKDKDVFDMDSLQKFMKTLANEIVDVKGNVTEFSNKPFRPFSRRIHILHLVSKLQKELLMMKKKERIMQKLKILICFGILMDFLKNMIQKNLLLLKPEVKVFLLLLNFLHQQILQIHSL
jgi:hypothetical protein